jgi:hypothetical protein
VWAARTWQSTQARMREDLLPPEEGAGGGTEAIAAVDQTGVGPALEQLVGNAAMRLVASGRRNRSKSWRRRQGGRGWCYWRHQTGSSRLPVGSVATAGTPTNSRWSCWVELESGGGCARRIVWSAKFPAVCTGAGEDQMRVMVRLSLVLAWTAAMKEAARWLNECAQL